MIVETPSGLIEVPLTGEQPYIQLTSRGEPQTYRSFDVTRLPDYMQALYTPGGYRPIQFGGPPGAAAASPAAPSPGASSVPAPLKGSRNLSQIVADGRPTTPPTSTPQAPRSAIESVDSSSNPFGVPGGAPDSPGVDTVSIDNPTVGDVTGAVATALGMTNPATAMLGLAANMIANNELNTPISTNMTFTNAMKNIAQSMADPGNPAPPSLNANEVGTAGSEAFGATAPSVSQPDAAFGPATASPTANANVSDVGSQAFGVTAPSSETNSVSPGATSSAAGSEPGGGGTSGGVGASSPSGGGGGPGASGAPGTAGSDAGGSVGNAGATGPGTSGADAGGGGGGGGGKFICGVLAEKGILPPDLYELDLRYGDDINARDPLVHRGYRVWGVPYAALMRRDDWIGAATTALAAKLALPWARQMAADVDTHLPPARWGKVTMAVTYPLCRALGRLAIWRESLTKRHIRTT